MAEKIKSRNTALIVFSVLELVLIGVLLFAPLRRLYLGMIGIGLGVFTMISFILSIQQWKTLKPYQPKVNSKCFLASTILTVLFNAWVCVHSVYIAPLLSSGWVLGSVIALCVLAIIIFALDISSNPKGKQKDKKK